MLQFGLPGNSAAKIMLNKAETFVVLEDGLEGIRGSAEDAIAAATTVEEVRVIGAETAHDHYLLLSSFEGVAVNQEDKQAKVAASSV